MPIMFNNGVLLIKPAGVAMDPACCCGAKCYCIQRLPDTLYLTVDFCGVNVIELTLYDEFVSSNENSCIKYYSGSGTFGAGPGIGFFRVAIGADSDPASFFLKYCFDGCTTGECTDPTNIASWASFNSIDCEPLYGDWTSGAPPGACGSCTDPWTLVITE
jgi:hypothetical protein